MVTNAASALGQAVGKLFEQAIITGLKATAAAHNCTIEPARLENGTGNRYQIDGVIFDAAKNPLALIDPKYIRYTKHNRDKGSWLCVAHYNLRKTYPSLRKSIAILAGNWSDPSIALIRSFGVEVFLVPFMDMVEVLQAYDVEFDWAEQDRVTSRQSWERYQQLSPEECNAIGQEMTASVMPAVCNAVDTVLQLDIQSIPQRVTEVEVILKTNLNEMQVFSHPTVSEAIKALLDLVADRPDIRVSAE